MRKLITTLLLVLALVGYIGLNSAPAAASTLGPAGQGFTVVREVISDNYNAQLPDSANLFGEDEAENNTGAPSDRDMDTRRGPDFGAGERWSPYNGYHHSDR